MKLATAHQTKMPLMSIVVDEGHVRESLSSLIRTMEL